MNRRWHWFVCCAICLLATWSVYGACQPEGPKNEVAQDSGSPDTATADTTAANDTAAKDQGTKDEGTKDEGVQDTGTKDNGAPKDDAVVDNGVPEPRPEPQPEPKPNDQGCGQPEKAVTTTTSDNVKIAADYWPAKTANRGAVVLVHMIPPNYNRTSYPQRVRKVIQELDLTVINIDRRGAGQSGGVARDAYAGTKTTLDIEAALKFIFDPARQCPIDVSKIALIGASNGTTSTLDYTVNRTDKSLPKPAALIWLSPGGYTEQQNKVSAALADIKALPLLFVFPSKEPYSKQYASTSPNWRLVELKNGAHGTNNFLRPGSEFDTKQTTEIVDWLKNHIAK